MSRSKEQRKRAKQLLCKPRGEQNKLSDMDRFKQLYKSFGKKVKERIDDDKGIVAIDNKNGYVIDLKEGEGFGGYSGFYSLIHFDNNGKFISQDFWE